MNLKEYEGKKIFSQFNINIPNSILIKKEDLDNIDKIVSFEKAALKAQVLSGGRGKAGLVKIVEKKDFKKVAEEFFNKQLENGLNVEEILFEELVQIKSEIYLSITLNKTEKCMTLIYSEDGGVEIESSQNVQKINFSKGEEIQSMNLPKDIIDLSQILYKIFSQYNCTLVEINPLIRTEIKLIALDSKITLDNNAVHLHTELEEIANKRKTKIEQQAAKDNIQYVELDGDIGVIGNGAGLVMATLDVINHYGGKPANFLDIGGGANKENTLKALELITSKKIKSIFINIFGGITRCDEIAKAIVEFKSDNASIPIVIRMIGTNEKQAKEILKQHGIEFVDSMDEGVKLLV